MENLENKNSLEQVKEESLTSDSLKKLASFYSLLADPTRLTIIALLCERELCVNDLASVLDMSQSRVSHQLAILRSQDIVKYYRKGKQVLYTIADNHIKDLFRTGLEHISEKDEEVYLDRKRRGI